jgi:hypothetical protein
MAEPQGEGIRAVYDWLAFIARHAWEWASAFVPMSGRSAGAAMISDKVKAWLAAGPASSQRIAAPVADAVAVGLNPLEATDVFHVVEGALQVIDQTIDQTIAALDRLETKSKSADVMARRTALQHASSPLRRVLQEARLGIRAEAEAFKGRAPMSVEFRRSLVMSSAESTLDPMAEGEITRLASQKGDL